MTKEIGIRQDILLFVQSRSIGHITIIIKITAVHRHPAVEYIAESHSTRLRSGNTTPPPAELLLVYCSLPTKVHLHFYRRKNSG